MFADFQAAGATNGVLDAQGLGRFLQQKFEGRAEEELMEAVMRLMEHASSLGGAQADRKRETTARPAAAVPTIPVASAPTKPISEQGPATARPAGGQPPADGQSLLARKMAQQIEDRARSSSVGGAAAPHAFNAQPSPAQSATQASPPEATAGKSLFSRKLAEKMQSMPPPSTTPPLQTTQLNSCSSAAPGSPVAPRPPSKMAQRLAAVAAQIEKDKAQV